MIHVQAGTYRGGYVVAKKLHLIADGRVMVDASTSADGTGFHIVGPGGSGSVVQGFIVEKATYEGILVGTSPGDANPKPAPVDGVVLRDNWVLWNNAGRGRAGAKGECAGHPPVPADCGGGIHLVWASNSTVENNIVAYNADGILLTDEFGPTSHNTLRGNRVLNNLFECGIVLAGHSPKAVGPDGKPTGRAGVFDNLIEKNLVRNNGVSLSGAGVLVGGGAPGLCRLRQHDQRQHDRPQRALGRHRPPAHGRLPGRQPDRRQHDRDEQQPRRRRLRRGARHADDGHPRRLRLAARGRRCRRRSSRRRSPAR